VYIRYKFSEYALRISDLAPEDLAIESAEIVVRRFSDLSPENSSEVTAEI
jgi:hypothetical protein